MPLFRGLKPATPRRLAGAILASMPVVALGATDSWTFAGSGNWALATNWSAGVPVSTNDVNSIHSDAINRTISYGYTGASIQFNSLSVSNSSTGSEIFSQGANVFNTLQETIASTGSAKGYWTLSGGTHNVNFANTSGGLFFGGAALARGVGTISGGTLNALNAGIFVGSAGFGTLTQSAGTISASLMTIGSQSLGNGVYNLNGGTANLGTSNIGLGGGGTLNMAGGTLNITGNELVGISFNGALNQSGGVHTVNGLLFTGSSSAGLGTCTVSGGASMTVNGSAYFGGTDTGSFGNGVLNVNGGTFKVPNTVKVWNQLNNAINLNGGTLSVGTLDTNGNPSRFHFNSGTLNLTQSDFVLDSTLSLFGSSLSLDANKNLLVASNRTEYIAENGSGSGSITQTGGLNSAGDLVMSYVGGTTSSYDMSGGTLLTGADFIAGIFGASTAVFNQSGGVHSCSGGVAVGDFPGAAGTINLSGGSFIVGGALMILGGTPSGGGTGVLTISGGTATVSQRLQIGDSGGAAPGGSRVNLVGGTLAVGTLDVSGNPARLNFAAGTFNFLNSLALKSGLPFTGSLDLTAAKTLVVNGTTSGDFSLPLILDGGCFSTGSLAFASLMQFNAGTFRLTASSLTVGASGLLGSTLQLNANQHVETVGGNTITVDSGALLVLNGGAALADAGVTNNGQIQLNGLTSTLSGGGLTNAGLLTGSGRVLNSLSNSGTVRASGTDFLQFTGAGNTNNGQINLLNGGEVEFTQGLTNLAGGTISGRGTLSAPGGISNSGTMQFSGGFTDVFGTVVNNTRITVTGGSTTTFYNAVTGNAGSNIRIDANSAAVFLGNVSVSFVTGSGTAYYDGSAVGGPLVNSGASIVDVGGSLAADFIRQNALTVSGHAAINPNGSSGNFSRVNSLSIPSVGKLDLADNDLIVDSTPLSTIRGFLVSAFNSGSWNGTGLTSSNAQATAGSGHKKALGYAAASSIGVSSFDGQAVSGATTLVRYTYSGDANLDGVVNALDFNALASNFGALPGKLWNNGDFNYDGITNTLDFTSLAANFNESALASPTLGVPIPEPGMFALVALAMCCLRTRTRREADKVRS